MNENSLAPPAATSGRSSLEPRSNQTEALLTFRAGSATLGVPAELVREICDRGDASSIPLSPPHVLGLMPLRGDAVPLVDLHRFLGLDPDSEPTDFDWPPRVLVVTAEGMTVGLCCNRVLGVEQVPIAALAPPRIHQGTSTAPYVSAEIDRPSGVLARLNLGALLKAARVGA